MSEQFDLEKVLKKLFDFDDELLTPNKKPILVVKTVLIADLVNSTAAKDKYGHSKGMKRCHLHNLIASKIFKNFNGKVIKILGDAVLAIFSENIDAIKASVVFRTALEKVKLPEDEFSEPLETRIALTHGSVEIIETELGTDIAGQVVDKAARLQTVASPGQILAEIGVIEPIRPILEEEQKLFRLPDNKEASRLHLKGFAETIKVFEIAKKDRPNCYPPSERGQYIFHLMNSITSCKQRVWLSTRHLKSSENRRDIRSLQKILAEMRQKHGVDVRIMHNGWDEESLKTAVELEELDLEVRFSQSPVDASVNLIDRETVIFSALKQGRFPHTRHWNIISYRVNDALAADFEKRWSEAISSQLRSSEILDKVFSNAETTIDRAEIIHYMMNRFSIGSGTFLDNGITVVGFRRLVRYIFIVGRPGTGKSTIRNLLSNLLENQLKLKTREVDDYDRLKEKYIADSECKRFAPRGAGGFIVKDHSVLAEVLKEISTDCISTGDTHLTWLIEFSRGHYTEAFNSFDARLLKKAVVIHISCGKQILLKRLTARAKSGGANVTEEVIEKFYKHDDAPRVCKELGIPCIEINNSTSIDSLKDKTEQIALRLRSIADTICH